MDKVFGLFGVSVKQWAALVLRTGGICRKRLKVGNV